MTTGEVMAAYLSAAGVRHVFGYPGDSNIEFIEALRSQGTQLVLGRREGTVGFMAEAYGMLTGRPGVCLSTLGPGSTALVNAVASAFLDRAPMLAISGQIRTDMEPYFTHQVVDHGRLFAPVTKWAGRVTADAVPTVMRKALRTAVAERPGPVHLTVSRDVAIAPAGDTQVTLPPLVRAEHSAQTFATGLDGAEPLSLLGKARHPVVLAGMSALRGDAGGALARFIERTGSPVVVSPMAKGVVPEDHPYFAGTVDMACNQVVWNFLGEADLLLAVGFDAVELIKPWKLTTPTIHIDSVPNTDQIYQAQVEVVGDISGILDSLTDAFTGEPRWSVAEVRRHGEHLEEAFHKGRVPGKLNPSDVVDAVNGAFPDDTIITTDVGSHKLLVGQGWKAKRQRSVLMSNGLSSMGFSLPAAITAKLIHRDRPVVCAVGDGGFAMVQGELSTASALGLGVVVVVFCDNSLNRIELRQLAKGYPSELTHIESTDLVKLAESMACDGVRVETMRALEDTLAIAARGIDRLLVVETAIDPSQYLSQF
jgi:acetolactate synthase I/II/III large subunit